MNTRERENLLGLLGHKKELLSQMRDLTMQFGVLLENDKVEMFSEGLQKREEIISKIDAFTRMERQMPKNEDEQVTSLRQQSQDIIREILKTDEQNAQAAQKKIEQYRAQIRSLNEQKKGIGQYSKVYKKNEAFYFDEKK